MALFVAPGGFRVLSQVDKQANIQFLRYIEEHT
jgi:hypothetical protein